MRMVAIPNRSSVAKTFQEFEEAGRMKPSSYYNRVVDLMEDLVKFTFLTRDVSNYLTDLYSERKGQSDTRNLKLLIRADRTSSLSKVP
jgi:arsenic resistance protein ArsH